MMTTARPRAWSSPAAMAISLPKLRLNETARKRGSTFVRAAVARRACRRCEPSSTKTTSQESAARSSTGVSVSTSSRRLSRLVEHGMTTDSSGRSCCVTVEAGARAISGVWLMWRPGPLGVVSSFQTYAEPCSACKSGRVPGLQSGRVPAPVLEAPATLWTSHPADEPTCKAIPSFSALTIMAFPRR